MRHPLDPSQPVGPPWMPSAVRDLTALGSIAVLSLVTAVVLLFLGIRRQFHALFLLLAAVVGALVLNSALKGFFERERPGLVPHMVEITSASFPSGHSMLSAAVYLTLGALLARFLGALRLKLYVIGIALALTFVVGITRIYLGVHYPSDVLAGWTVGLVWAVVCWLAARFLQRRGKVEPPA